MDLEQTFLKDWFTHTRTQCDNMRTAHMQQYMHVHVYALCAHVSAHIFIKFLLQAHYYLIDKIFKALVAEVFVKYHLCFFNYLFSMYFSYLPNYALPKPSNMDN